MPRTSRNPKDETFNFRVDPELKEAFSTATEAADKPAAQVLREFMRAYVEARRGRDFSAEARRQSLLIAKAAQDASTDEASIMAELDAGLDELMRDGSKP